MPVKDKQVGRRVHRELYRSTAIDASLLTVACVNGVVYLGGRVRGSRGPLGRGADLKHEMEKVAQAVQRWPAVRDVVCDFTIVG